MQLIRNYLDLFKRTNSDSFIAYQTTLIVQCSSLVFRVFRYSVNVVECIDYKTNSLSSVKQLCSIHVYDSVKFDSCCRCCRASAIIQLRSL